MRELVTEALKVLGIDRLSCAVHDRCLPSDGPLDVGAGAIGGAGAEAFLEFLSALGFNAVQLGPAGEISRHNLSPYDGTAFSRSRLQLSWAVLDEGPLSVDDEPAPAIAGDRSDYARAFSTSDRRWAALHARWERLARAGDPRLEALEAGLSRFREREGRWLETDALHRVLSTRHGDTDPGAWPDRTDAQLFDARAPATVRRHRLEALLREHHLELVRYAREQYLLADQHRRFTERAHDVGLRVWADLQVGLSHADRWANASLMLEGYAMGAPPSRTNPEGQPWGYPVLSPAQEPGASAFRKERFYRLFRDYDGLRVDHPHGLVCPWIYREGARDEHQAVREGARLFSVGEGVGHDEVAAFDLVEPGQLDRRVEPWTDAFVTDLREAQVARYAQTFDQLLDAARAAGRGSDSVACEVLSTMPAPLGRVIARHGLGRFRVTQKANVVDPSDVYLPANAAPEDWVMVGTHDTPTIWRTAERWSDEVAAARREHVVACLAPDGVGRAELGLHFARSRDHLAGGELAVLFTTRARHVMLWVFDLLGSHELYNRAGVVHPDNWTLRVPPGFRAEHVARAKTCAAFDPCFALALALAARPREERSSQAGLIRALAARASSLVPALDARLAG